MAKVIYLSPSIQIHNMFCVGGVTESQNSNAVTDILEKALREKYNFTVYRNNPNMDTVSQIVSDSNSKNPNIHIAIHSNAGGGRGCEVYAYEYANGVSNSHRLAQYIYDEMSSVTPSNDRGVKDGVKARLGEVINTKACAVLIEMAFHDNAEDANWLINNRQACATAMEKGICKYFDVTYIPDVVEVPKEESTKLYRVQVGAFSVKANADKMLARLKEAGFNGYIVG